MSANRVAFGLCGFSAILALLKLVGLFPFSWWLVVAPALFVSNSCVSHDLLLGFQCVLGVRLGRTMASEPQKENDSRLLAGGTRRNLLRPA